MEESNFSTAETYSMQAQNLWLSGDKARTSYFNGACMYRMGCCAFEQGNVEAAIKHIRDEMVISNLHKGDMEEGKEAEAEVLLQEAEALYRSRSEDDQGRSPTEKDYDGHKQHKSFFVYHALDYVSHARQSLPTVFCALFPDTPLPCPSHIWEAPTDTEWSVRYRAWEDFCGNCGPLRYKDILRWVLGKETGCEEQLRVWFLGIEVELGGVVFNRARAQGRTEGAEEFL
ncbi:hypothetical protein C8A00DRAFT_38159 [Chaetomidium leptoderma]|uniref:Uncharacterized protein n=1 Tax=Chaetomidium leptoderma TaxID=669021 RepID=A0AAN6VD23_9PEZI|nr:hypothetical protein C8A00DRAFT_38159 [Chaetomidium leptoderma]